MTMTQAGRDQNNEPTLILASGSDGVTPVQVQADPTTHGLVIDDDTTGSDHGRAIAVRDQNGVPVLMAVSSADGVTPVEVYGKAATNAIMIDSS